MINQKIEFLIASPIIKTKNPINYVHAGILRNLNLVHVINAKMNLKKCRKCRRFFPSNNADYCSVECKYFSMQRHNPFNEAKRRIVGEEAIERNKKIFKSYKEGKSQKEIAYELKLTNARINQIIRMFLKPRQIKDEAD